MAWLIEPEAKRPDRDIPWDDPDAGPNEYEIELSRTISAKRQADALERIADALTGVGENILNQSLNDYGENIGRCIQGQFERSQR